MGPGQPSIVVQPGTKGGGLSEYRSPTRNQHCNPTTSIVIQPGTNTFLRFGRRLRCFCFHKARGLLFLSEARASLPSHTPSLLLLHNKLSPPFLYKVHSFSVRDKTSFPSHRPGLPFPQRRSAWGRRAADRLEQPALPSPRSQGGAFKLRAPSRLSPPPTHDPDLVSLSFAPLCSKGAPTGEAAAGQIRRGTFALGVM